MSAKLSKSGAIAILTFSGTAGQKIFEDILSATLPGKCGGFSIRAPDGSMLDSACIKSGTSSFKEKGIVLLETGKYTIVIDLAEGNTGEITVRVRL